MDLSLDHIAMSDPLYDRFAIMLIDNCMELFLHRFALNYVSRSKMWHFSGETEKDDKVARMATGQNFNEKIKLAVREKVLSKAMGESVRLLHEYRNTSYHAGMKHEGILNGMAKLYFHILAQVLSEYRPSSWGYNPSEVPNVRVLKYVGSAQACHSSAFLGEVFPRLMLVIENMGQTLKGDLIKSAETMIEECDWGIDFIVKNSPSWAGIQTRDAVVLDAEVWAVWCSDKANGMLSKSDLNNPSVDDCIKWLSNNYPGLCKKDPIPNWTKRVNTMKATTCSHEILSKYCNFVKQTESVRTNIWNSVGALEAEIDRQIDAARGK